MGHLSRGYGVYGKLRKRLDRFAIGAPSSREIFEILRLLYTEEEASIAARMPIKFSSLARISKVTGVSMIELRPILEGMAEKGLVIDFGKNGRIYYILSPTLLGFFEFTFMRVRRDVPQKELAALMWEYVHENPQIAKKILSGETPLGRALVQEDSLEEIEHSQILTFETASGLIREARKIAVGLCYCRHVRGHVRDPCKYPMDVCTALNGGASYLVRRDFMREVSKEEALDIFSRTKEEGLVYVADNVKNRPSFVCHCCGCCCGMLGALKKFQLENTVATSSYIAEIDVETCTGCGLCAKKCQVDMITLEKDGDEKYGKVNSELCLGCGVCFDACRQGALKVVRRGERVLTPESAMEKYLTIALEQGKLGNFLFDNFTSLPHAALRNLVNAISRIQPVKDYLAKEDLQSRFLKAMSAK
jgi:Na+-translocating ferredoxin:NAD+ oxidoreductase RNF subunit RnfB